jgi:hypothetical protein
MMSDSVSDFLKYCVAKPTSSSVESFEDVFFSLVVEGWAGQLTVSVGLHSLYAQKKICFFFFTQVPKTKVGGK